MAKKPKLESLAQFRVSRDQLGQMKQEAVDFGYTDLADMLRTGYRELRQRLIAERQVQDERSRKLRK